MMGDTSTSAGSGISSRPSVRMHLLTGGVVAGAGILASSLVVVTPPDADGATTEVRAVQFAAFALPSPTPLGALLENFVSKQAQTVRPVAPVSASGVPDLPPRVLVRVVPPSASLAQETRAIAEPTNDPAINNQGVSNTALAATSTAFDLNSILAPILPIIGPILLFGPIIALVVLACLPCAVVNVVTSLIRSILIDLTPVPTAATTLTTDSLLSISEPVTAAEAGPADAAPAVELGKTDDSPPATSTGATRREQKSTDTERVTSTRVTTTAQEVEPATAPSAGGGLEPADGAAPEREKPNMRPAKPRPVARDSLDVSDSLDLRDSLDVRDLARRGKAGNPTTRTDVGGDGPATTGRSAAAASPDDSSPTRRNSKGSNASEDEANRPLPRHGSSK